MRIFLLVCPSGLFRYLMALAAAVAGAAAGHAADVIKADNTDNLILGSSWSGGTAPTAADVGVWDATVTGANTAALGGSASWGGIRIASPGGLAAITTGAGQTLTLGGSGIDMSAATQNLSLTSSSGAGLAVGADQIWTIAAGRSLTWTTPSSTTANLGGFTVTKSGAGQATLAGVVLSAGTLDITEGLVTLQGYSSLNFGIAASASVNTTGGGRLRLIRSSGVPTVAGTVAIDNGSYVVDFSSNSTLGGTVTIGAGGGTMEFTTISGGNATTTLNSVISGGGSLAINLAKTGAGNPTLLVGGANTHTGGTTIGGSGVGTTRLAASERFADTGNLTVFAGTFDIAGFDETVADVTVTGAATVSGSGGTLTGSSFSVSHGTGTATISARLAGASGLTKTGNGVLALSGANSYAGGTTYTTGTGALNVSGDQSAATGGWSIGSTGSGTKTVTFQSGSTVVVAADKEIRIGNVNASGSNTQTLTVAGAVTNNGTLLVGRPAVLNLNSGGTWAQAGGMTIGAQGGFSATTTIAAGGTFTYSGSDTVKVNGAQGNTGQANLNVSGTFVTAAGFEQTTNPTTGYGAVNLLSGGTLRLSQSVAALTTGVRLTAGAGGGTIDTNGFNTAVSADITGAGGLTKAGGGTLTLSGANTYLGGTTVSAGTLTGSTTSLQGDITNDAAVTFDQTGDGTYAGVMDGIGSLTKSGVGSVTLTGANTYLGGTTVSAGTLLVSNTSGSGTGAGTVTVASGATLGGTGSISGATTIDGTHSPGASPGLQTFSGGLTYGSGSSLLWELSSNTDLQPFRSSLYDGINVTGGSLEIAAGATINLDFTAPWSDGTTPSDVDWANTFWNADHSWTVIEFSSAAPATSSGLFTLGTVGPDSLGQSLNSVAGRENASFAIVRSGDNVVLQYSAVPEPGSLAVLAVASLAAAGWLRRRR